ncbi:hypothetical protein BJ741DRAFT_651637, partial [Chytriomyces cf. hyalinus JEL632]
MAPRKKYSRLIKRESQGSNPAASTVSVDEENSASRGYEEMKHVTKSQQDWSQTMLASPATRVMERISCSKAAQKRMKE